MGGQVVRAVAGRRAEYRPIVSRLTSSSAPLDVARTFRDQFGLSELYVADLDAITGTGVCLSVHRELAADGFRLWVDGGLRGADDAVSLFDACVAGVVAGLETLSKPDELARLCQRWGDRIVFSLDLREGKPLGARAWGNDPREIANTAVSCGARRLLLLDLARVGRGEGTGTGEMSRRLSAVHPAIELWAGGGVSDIQDIKNLQSDGVAVSLVASALHDGRLTRDMIEADL